MKKIKFFNIGAYIGETTKLIIDMCKDLGLEYKIYQFEPISHFVMILKEKFGGDKNIKTYPVALFNKKGKMPIYKATRPDGSSLHSAKWNVNKDDFEMVDTILFSEWYKREIKRKAKNDIFIMKVSTNGSEWEFFTDLIENGINKYIDIYCGKIYGNVQKRGIDTKEEIEEFQNYLVANGIEEIPLTCYNFEDIELIKEAVKKLL